VASQPQEVKTPNIVVRQLSESDLSAADQVFRLAFGTFLGLPDPATTWADVNYVHTRWRADPTAALGAEVDGELVASNFAANWGSVGFFGPLTVRPDFWDQGVAKRLLEPTMDLFAKWGTQHIGLFTFAHSPKHIALYQKFGFWPRFLTPIMSKPVQPPAKVAGLSRYAEVLDSQREGCLAACRELTHAIYEGLDLEAEIRAVNAQKLGETALLWKNSKLVGLAVCHCGQATEAGSDTCYIKFGAVRPGSTAARDFQRLLDTCEALASEKGMARLVAGVNTARHEAYRIMAEKGFRTEFQGVAMELPNEPGYNRADVYLIDDWR